MRKLVILILSVVSSAGALAADRELSCHDVSACRHVTGPVCAQGEARQWRFDAETGQVQVLSAESFVRTVESACEACSVDGVEHVVAGRCDQQDEPMASTGGQ